MRDDAGRMQRLLKVEEGLRLLEADSEEAKLWIGWLIQGVETFEVQPIPEDGDGGDPGIRLCVRTVDRCQILYSTLGGGRVPPFVASTVTFDGPGGEHVVVATGGGGYAVAEACIGDPAAGLWTITAEADGYQTAVTTATVVSGESQTVRVELCPTRARVIVTLSGCIPIEACGPIEIELDGPGVITPDGPIDYWDTGSLTLFEVDLAGVTLDGDCAASLEWNATVTPPAGTGLAPVTGPTVASGGVCYPYVAELEIAVPPGMVCACGSVKPIELEFSDDWGACTLTHGAPCSILADWLPGSPPLSSIAPWIGSYSFTCDKAYLGAPCYGGSGSFSGNASVTVTIAAGCGTVYKIFSVFADCEGNAGLISTPPDSGLEPVGGYCRLVGSYSNEPCDPSVMGSGAWSKPSQAGVCSGILPGYIGTPCVEGNWTLTG